MAALAAGVGAVWIRAAGWEAAAFRLGGARSRAAPPRRHNPKPTRGHAPICCEATDQPAPARLANRAVAVSCPRRLSRHGSAMTGASAMLAHRAADLDREQLLRIAVARGCRHYSPLLSPGMEPRDDPEIPHEALGAALLCGPADAATFQAIRCGAMVLSDLKNSPRAIDDVSRQLGVAHRAAHIARLGLAADTHPDFWERVLRELPSAVREDDFLPGISRFTSETRQPGGRSAPVRVWLRTHYAR